jgi:SAM-dependent methyltransferase
MGKRSFDLIADIYDTDMGMNAPTGDIGFYISCARRCGGPVLELGCGTGRVSLPLVKSGFEVDGIDASPAMLQILRHKAKSCLTAEELGRLRSQQAEMCNFSADRIYALALCPFSTFNYLIEEVEQAAMLERVRACLKPGGRFVVDVFAPHYEVLVLPDDHVFHDYRRILDDGTVLLRTKTIHKGRTRQVNRITRLYNFFNGDGREIRRIETREEIRYFFFNEMRLLLHKYGFHVDKTLGDFQGTPYCYGMQNMIYVCSP